MTPPWHRAAPTRGGRFLPGRRRGENLPGGHSGPRAFCSRGARSAGGYNRRRAAAVLFWFVRIQSWSGADFFSRIGAESDAPVRILNLEAERYPRDGGEHDPLLAELISDGGGASRILVDLATASRQVTSRLLVLRPTVLVPLLPDMSSVASLGSLEAFLGRDEGAAHYLLNQFDGSSPLHRDVRGMLQQRLGDRLLPLVLRRSAAVSEALAEGMTVIDYAPGSATAEDYWDLAGWLRGLSAPAAPAGCAGVSDKVLSQA